jgi:restriction endonuclease-like protein
MSQSTCTMSFLRNDLQVTRLWKRQCPVKNCSTDIQRHKVPFQRYKGKMRDLPFCPEHGIRIHTNGFVYYNGRQKTDLITATKRNLLFHGDYYVDNFLKNGNKMESGRLCYENSEDALTFNVFTELLANGEALKKLASHFLRRKVEEEVELYLWGGKIDLKRHTFTKYGPLQEVRRQLEGDIKRFGTEPDIMLVIPRKAVICIEAKFGSKNSLALDKDEIEGEKPKKKDRLVRRYCTNNKIIDTGQIIDLENLPPLFYEQLFRNIIFAASMAKLEGNAEWHVVNLRNQHVMNLKRGKPESQPIKRNMRSLLKPKYKKHFSHMTWEDLFELTINGQDEFANLTWYLKNKSLGCSRAFNIL